MPRLDDWFTGRYLDPRTLRVASCAVLVMGTVLLAAGFATEQGGRTAFGSELGGDYPQFHVAGTILNESPPEALYDFALQDRLYHRALPATPAEESLPYAYPPFVAVFFRPLASLPYAWSFATWLLVSAGLYLFGLACVAKTLPHLSGSRRATALLLALSFQPFVIDCWLGGQLSVFGFCFIALALLAESRNRPVLAGFAYGLCLYKPTLVALILPMLVVAGRWRSLLGFAACGLLLGLVSLAAVGWPACEAYLRVMSGYVSATTDRESVFRLWKYVDVNSFMKLLLGARGRVAAVVVVAVALPFLVRAWWRLDRRTEWRRRLVLAGTITATLVLNLYVGNYDTILAVLGVLLTADVLLARSAGPERGLPPAFRWLLVLLWVVPWFSQVVARETGFQPQTLVLAAAAAYPLLLARRENPPGGSGEPAASIPAAPQP